MNWKKYASALEEILMGIELRPRARSRVNELLDNIKHKCDDGEIRYILVEWPEYQYFMDGLDWSKCIRTEDNSYMVPEDLYYDVINQIGKNLEESKGAIS